MGVQECAPISCGKATLIVMDDVLKSISSAGSIDELFPILEWISKETERIVNAQKVSAMDVQKIAGYLTDIRLLLNELSHYQVWPDVRDLPASNGKTMAQRYLELEGKIKEIRNDLNRAMKRMNG